MKKQAKQIKEDVASLNEAADDILSEWEDKTDKMAEKLTKAIYYMLKKMGGSAEVDTIIGEDSPLISYDGGNYPEFDSTINASVVRVTAFQWRRKPSFVVDLEEEDRYPVSRMSKADIPVIYNFVKGKYEDFIIEAESEIKSWVDA